MPLLFAGARGGASSKTSKDVKEGAFKAKDLFDSSEKAGAARQDVCVVKASKVAASTPAP